MHRLRALLARLAAELGRLAAALERYATSGDVAPSTAPSIMPPGPPAHWVETVRARAPHLLDRPSLAPTAPLPWSAPSLPPVPRPAPVTTFVRRLAVSARASGRAVVTGARRARAVWPELSATRVTPSSEHVPATGAAAVAVSTSHDTVAMPPSASDPAPRAERGRALFDEASGSPVVPRPDLPVPTHAPQWPEPAPAIETSSPHWETSPCVPVAPPVRSVAPTDLPAPRVRVAGTWTQPRWPDMPAVDDEVVVGPAYAAADVERLAREQRGE